MSGTIFLAHPVLAPISERVLLDAVPDDRQRSPYRIATVQVPTTTLAEIDNYDWWEARTQQEQWYRSELEPLLRAYPDYRVSYFGAAPIPLAFHLGYLVGGFRSVEVHLQHHETREWRWSDAPPQTCQWRPLLLPNRVCHAAGDVVIRISTSHRIDPEDTRVVVGRPLAEIDLELELPDEDAFASPEAVAGAGRLFSQCLDAVARDLPNADRVHVFAAVPVGVAFKLGTCVNPTIHHAVQTYQFNRTATPRYQAALVLQGDQPPAVSLSADAANKAAQARAGIAEQIDRIRQLGSSLHSEATGPAWWEGVFPGSNPFCGRLARLPCLSATMLMRCDLDHETTEIADGFRFDARRGWQFSDDFLARLIERFPDEERLLRACRMLLLHEGLHATIHRLTDATAMLIRRLPKVVEELDYEADVWALVHELAFAGDKPRLAELRELVDIALDTFWCFDDQGRNLERIEIRRLNRYLIWYWQSLALDRCHSVSDAVVVLAEKPIIEIAGPKIQSAGDRIFYVLEQPRYDAPEIGGCGRNGLFRFGDGPSSRVVDLLNGFRNRDGQRIRSALKSVFDQVT